MVPSVIAAHESRRPKPTVDDVARAIRAAYVDSAAWDSLSDWVRDYWRTPARVIFTLFGVEP